MVKVRARRPNPYERQKLHRMKRQCTNPVNSRHARVILLSGGGVSNAEIAWRVGYSDVWVRQIIRRFNDGGVPAISWYPYYCAHGEPRKFFSEIVEQVVEVALSSPKALIGMNCWSLAKQTSRFAVYTQEIRSRHARKQSFIHRLDRAGL
ncbi:MAG TPA: hypothetical protein VMZ31_12455 [Phycisphaerae bacterium]|nr:hypothetical protein [Phycisphaerae bacterium]